MMNLNTKSLIVALVAATPLFFWSAGAVALTPIESLGKNIFFDQISIPGNKQGLCFMPRSRQRLDSAEFRHQRHTVVAPGAKPHAAGNIKTPSNAYASFSPPFHTLFRPPYRLGKGATSGMVAPKAAGQPVAYVRRRSSRGGQRNDHAVRPTFIKAGRL